MKMEQSMTLVRKLPAEERAVDSSPHLERCVDRSLAEYFNALGGEQPVELYRRVLDQVEPPLLDRVMVHTRGNQSRAAEILGISRGTLRTKLKRHGMA
ncbi:MAG: helix-turn-helix domain-containing protein [Pseudomonadota bacterium]